MANVSSVASDFADLAKADLLGAMATPLLNFFTSVQKNPTLLNIAAQGQLLLSEAIDAGPTVGQELLTSLSNMAISNMNSVIAHANAQAQAAAATAAAAAAPATPAAASAS